MKNKVVLLLILLTVILASVVLNVSCDKTDACVEHLFDDWENVIAAGCEADGKRTRKCLICDKTEEEDVKAFGHSFSEYVSDENATCIDGTKTATCLNGCGKTDTVTDTGGGSSVHSMTYLKTTLVKCDTPSESISKCINCNHTESVMIAPASGHFLTSYVVEAQKKNEGSDCNYSVTLVGSCGVCSGSNVCVTKTETMHSYSVSLQAEATCQSAGVKIYKCTACDKEPHTKPYSNANGHVWSASGGVWNGEQMYVCSNSGCGVTKSIIAVVSDTHTVDKSALAASELKLGNVVMSIDDSVLDNLSDGNVTLSARYITDSALRDAAMSGLSNEQRTALNGKPIYDFEMNQSGVGVSDFGGGKITVTVPYTLDQGEDPECVAVWYLSDSGKVEYVSAVYSNGTVTFEVSHFSTYAVAAVSAADACEVNGHSYFNGTTTISPSCTSVGYTVKVCSRCGNSAIGNIVASLGHAFNDAPEHIPPTCTTLGKYTYFCSADGCDYKLEVPIHYSHDWQYKESKSATCQDDGYTLYTCSKCGDERKDAYPRDPSYHDTHAVCALVNGATDCADGVDIGYRCKNAGCDYYEYSYTINDHVPMDKFGDGGQQITPKSLTVDLDEHLAELKGMLGDYLDISMTVTESTCACGKGVSFITFTDEGNYFGDLSNSNIYDSDFPNDYRLEMGPNNSYAIRIVKRIEDEGCKRYFYVDVLVDYDAVNGTAAKTYTYLVSTKAAHTIEEDARLAEGATLCADGIVQIWKCTVCQKVTSEREMSVNGHYYIYNRLPFDLSGYSAVGHRAIIREGRCPCGMSEYKVTYPSDSIPMERCSFVNTETVTDGNSTVKTFACTCGISYRETVTVSQLDPCAKRTYRFISYGNYNADTDSFDNSVGLPAHVDAFYHSHKSSKSYTYKNGCYVEYTSSYVCDCGDAYPYYSYSGSGYEHSLVVTEETDSMGNVITTERCEECDHVKITALDENGNLVRQYAEITDPKVEEKTVTIRSYRLIGDISEEAVYKKECYDLSGTLKSWEQTVYIYVTNADGQGEKLVYTLYSDGRNDFNSIPLY